MLCVVTEETERVIGERRLATLRELACELSGHPPEDQVFDAVPPARGQQHGPALRPCVRLRRLRTAWLAASTGFPVGRRTT